MPLVAQRVPDVQLQDTNPQTHANSYMSHIVCILLSEIKGKNTVLHWKHSIYIKTRVAFSKVLIRSLS